MNAKTADLQALEAHIAARIDARDVNVLCDYAAFASDQLDDEPVRHLLLALLTMDERICRFALAEMGTHSRSLMAAVRDLHDQLDQQRAAFQEHAARAILDEAKGIKA